MSLKTNKFNNRMMSLAISLAEQRIGLTGENPSVGCVIVKNNKIISFGQTGLGGTPHAEVDAINKAKESLKNSSIYITLEPCCHYGKTPPCTKKIIQSKIKKVYYGIDDVDVRTAKKSSKVLRKSGIFVKKNILKTRIKKLYKSYFFLRRNNIPYVTGKIACSKNNLINSKDKYITNKKSRDISHLLRFKNHAILVSSRTVNQDNPILNCRIDGLDKYSPIRIIVDKNLKINKNSIILKTSKNYKTFIFYNKVSQKLFFLKKKGVKLILSPLDTNGNIDLAFVLKEIKKRKIHYLLVEGGKMLTNYFVNKKYFKEFYLFKTNSNLKKSKNSINISDIIKKLSVLFNSKKKLKINLDSDNIIKYV